jgi:hypothetical protein
LRDEHLAYPSSWPVARISAEEQTTLMSGDDSGGRRGSSGRLLVVVLVVQLVLAGVLIWMAATGFSWLRSWL